MVEHPIIKYITDNDLYTFTVGQVAFQQFPDARVEYVFINRGKTKFPTGFDVELKQQLKFMSHIKMKESEFEFLNKLGYFDMEYLQFLMLYRFNPNDLTITFNDGDLHVVFKGTWIDAIMWEVPFLALVSELYYKMTGAVKDDDWRIRIHKKTRNMSDAGCKWMEFGTRRRFDFDVQNEVVLIMKQYPGFLGTSNVRLAMVHNVPVNGTMSHQGPMAMQANVGATLANKAWRNAWKNTYKGKLMTFLPDTFTTDVFLRDFTKEEALEWNLRQDSGSPDVFVQKILNFYDQLGIDTTKKTIVLSDSLTDELFKEYTLRYRDRVNIVGGIGTSLSNDVGHKPLSIVIKLSSADFGRASVDVVKLSDTAGKHTGTPEAIKAVKTELGL